MKEEGAVDASSLVKKEDDEEERRKSCRASKTPSIF